MPSNPIKEGSISLTKVIDHTQVQLLIDLLYNKVAPGLCDFTRIGHPADPVYKQQQHAIHTYISSILQYGIRNGREIKVLLKPHLPIQ